MAKLTAKEAAKRLGVTDARIRQMVAEKKLPSEMFGRNLMIDDKDLDNIGDRKPGPKPKPAKKVKK